MAIQLHPLTLPVPYQGETILRFERTQNKVAYRDGRFFIDLTQLSNREIEKGFVSMRVLVAGSSKRRKTQNGKPTIDDWKTIQIPFTAKAQSLSPAAIQSLTNSLEDLSPLPEMRALLARKYTTLFDKYTAAYHLHNASRKLEPKPESSLDSVDYNEGKVLYDFSFISKWGAEVKAHKFIVSRIGLNDFDPDGTENSLVIDVARKTLSKFVGYLYIRTVKVDTLEEAQDLYNLSVRFKMKLLQDAVADAAIRSDIGNPDELTKPQQLEDQLKEANTIPEMEDLYRESIKDIVQLSAIILGTPRK
jgi:hypothetical protein